MAIPFVTFKYLANNVGDLYVSNLGANYTIGIAEIYEEVILISNFTTGVDLNSKMTTELELTSKIHPSINLNSIVGI